MSYILFRERQLLNMTTYIFSSESVAKGHPDKLCDQVSDAVLDLFLTKDPVARVACETVATTNYVGIFGETRSGAVVNNDELEHLVRTVVKDIGYNQDGFNPEKLTFESRLHQQSADIALGVDASSAKDEGEGDKGMMFGYACQETKTYMPACLYYSHEILKAIATAREEKKLPFLLPDGKSQVSLVYENGIPVGIHAVVLSHQHTPAIEQEAIKEALFPYIKSVFPKEWEIPQKQLYVNPTGRFVIGGPDGDTGLTGRKIIVDTYGGAAPHGGGAFSGKDPTKVDRSAAYMARYLAKNIVASGMMHRCTLQLAYAIGVSQPVSLFIDSHGNREVDLQKLTKLILNEVNLSPRGIRTILGLNKPIYQKTACYGHFGRTPLDDGSFSWEKTDLVDFFKSHF